MINQQRKSSIQAPSRLFLTCPHFSPLVSACLHMSGSFTKRPPTTYQQIPPLVNYPPERSNICEGLCPESNLTIAQCPFEVASESAVSPMKSVVWRLRS
ncbi:hypothetical protein L873DRAFT_1157483 [Choiromyces venosus 120613-1]|uniref:Uncharacterized protein n=1 Tax=Choiromyces venosus 120613-1 TaxID=1336337 RepID=A0A3N4JIK2_9PEZI|nr:hypothetical protein L873DRAFT_1157483 [Choiromyces venosus 120613-1]